MRPIRSIATALLVAAIAVAGCTRSQPHQGDTAAGQPPAVTAAATSAPAVTAPPATQAPHKAPSTAPVVLADGRHPVYLKTINPDRRTITFDLIQLYWGDEAVREAAKDHQESPPPNDHYIRNVNPRLRTLPVPAGATITVNTLAAGYTGSATTNVKVSLPRLELLLSIRGYDALFWITVRDDQVLKIAEQYIP